MIVVEIILPGPTQMPTIDLTAKGWEYAVSQGPFAVFWFVTILAFIAYAWRAERVMARQSETKEKLHEKRVIERDETTRALVTTAIALEKVNDSTVQGNKALDALIQGFGNLQRAVEQNTAKIDHLAAVIEARRRG